MNTREPDRTEVAAEIWVVSDDEKVAVESINVTHDAEIETRMEPDEYKMEFFPDRYGGVVIPIPVGPRKPQHRKVGETVHGTFELDSPNDIDKIRFGDFDIVINMDEGPPKIIEEASAQKIETNFTTGKAMVKFTSDPKP
jgi:plastocyanin domain-containing protein